MLRPSFHLPNTPVNYSESFCYYDWGNTTRIILCANTENRVSFILAVYVLATQVTVTPPHTVTILNVRASQSMRLS